MEATIPLASNKVPIGLLAILAALVLLGPRAASQERTSATLSPGRTFSEEDGASIYANLCQGCHMRDGGGAVGAGSYPALAGDRALGTSGFVIDVVLNGLRSMPSFGRSLTDAQVAAVVTYVRARFGNADKDPVAPSEVGKARP